MRLFAIIVALVMALGGANHLRAQTSDFTPPAVGTKFYPSSGGYFEVNKVDGRTMTTVNAVQRELLWLGGIVGFQPGYQFSREEAEKLWPLEIGKKVTFPVSGTSQGYSATWQWTITVKSAEKVTTEAGTFDTFVIEARERAIGYSYEGFYTYHYSPELGFSAKASYQVVLGNARPWSWTLTRVAKPVSGG
jgi:hypothetical protein